MHPSELLALVVEVAVVIVGFAALVTTLGNVSEQMRKIRIRVIYQESGLAFAAALTGLILLGTSLPSDMAWRICSGICVFAAPMSIRRINEDRKAIVTDRWSVFLGYAILLASASAQVANLYYGEFWLFSIALGVSLSLSISVFIEFFRLRPLQ